MTRPPRFLVALLCVVAFTLGGCGTTPDARVAQLDNSLAFYIAQSDAADGDITTLERTLAELAAVQAEAEAAGDTGAVAEALAAVTKVQGKLTKAREVKAKADSVAKKLRDQIAAIKADGDVEIDEELALYAGVTREVSGALPTPFNYIGYGLAALLTAGGEVLRRRKNRQLKQVVDGAADLVENISTVTNPAEAKATLKARQDPATRKLVDTLRVQ